MELVDALKIIAVRDRFATDLELALRLVGCRLDVLVRREVPTVPADDGSDDLGELLFDMTAHELLLTSRADGWTVVPDDSIADDSEERDGQGREEHDGARQGLSWRGEGHEHEGGRRARRTYSAKRRATVALLLEGQPPDDEEPPPYRSIPQKAVDQRAHHRRRSSETAAMEPRTGAAVIRSMMRRPNPGSGIDVEALVDRIARVEPIDGTPRRPRRRVRGRVGLLYDVQLLVGPYSQDVREVCELIAQLVPSESLATAAFRGDPTTGCGAGPIWTWEPFRPPDGECTLVFVTGTYGEDDKPRARRLSSLLLELRRGGHNATVIWLGSEVPPDRNVRDHWHSFAR